MTSALFLGFILNLVCNCDDDLLYNLLQMPYLLDIVI